MIARAAAIAAFHDAVAACNPRDRVAAALADAGPDAEPRAGHARVGIAIGKAALAMARGAGPVARGVAVTVADDGEALPAGWRAVWSAHPEPDERSLAGAATVRGLLDSATGDDLVLALISGGASALIEEPRGSLAELRATLAALMAAGAPIGELNTVRGALSAIKAGQLAEACGARVVTLVASDVLGDALDVVGSGPTIGPWLASPGQPVDAGARADVRRRAAIAILERHAVTVPAVLETPQGPRFVTRDDRAELVIGMSAFAEATRRALAERQIDAPILEPPLEGELAAAADLLAAHHGPCVAWGEPTLRVPPDHGEGGRAQQLALELAKRLRGTTSSALVAGSDGIDGPPPRGRAAPAGAYVDGGTWDAIRAAGIDPDLALARCDAGTALDAVGALFVTGPTGVNHADVAIVA